MIQKIPRSQIHWEKYQKCLQQADNYTVCAEPWYLDRVSNQQWELWMAADYTWVMPVCFVKKWGVKIIVHPLLTFQLGVIGPDSNMPFDAFYKTFQQQLIHGYHFNEGNPHQYKGMQSRVNYILPLQSGFENQFRKDRLKDIRRMQNLDLELSDTGDISILLDLYLHHIPQVNTPKMYMEQLIRTVLTHQSLDIRVLKDRGEVKAFIMMLRSGNRRIFMLGWGDKSNSYKGILAYLLFLYFQEQSSDCIIDFEGSMIPGVADFFKSFGAEVKPYAFYKSPIFKWIGK